MADDEQFSLCWNNFNSNLSAGFHESLCRGDLVDVTLAAEGQLVKAHRLVLSVCSPYFRKMFTQMPANQHAFVFLKDVSHTALKDLIQFMYCGEVNVKQDALPTFISTAEALQIKGLTETGETNPSNTAGSVSSPVKAPTPAPSIISMTSPQRPQRSGIQRNISRTSYKQHAESEDSSDDKPLAAPSQKRVLQRSITPQTSTPAQKRMKSESQHSSTEPTIIHLPNPQIIQVQVQQQPSQQQQQQQQQQQHQIMSASVSIADDKSIGEPEFIDMPMEMPTKSEPEYADESAEVETIEHEPEQDQDQEHDETEEGQEDQEETTYVEDETYGDMKYDESYFTENDETKPGTSGFGESYAEAGGDTTGTEAQANEPDRKPAPRQALRRAKSGDLIDKDEDHLTHHPTYLIKITAPPTPDDHLTFIRSQRGAPLLVRDGFVYRCERKSEFRSYWLCTGYKRFKCNGRIICQGNALVKATYHIHEAEWKRIAKAKIERQDMEADDRDAFLNSIKR